MHLGKRPSHQPASFHRGLLWDVHTIPSSPQLKSSSIAVITKIPQPTNSQIVSCTYLPPQHPFVTTVRSPRFTYSPSANSGTPFLGKRKTWRLQHVTLGPESAHFSGLVQTLSGQTSLEIIGPLLLLYHLGSVEELVLWDTCQNVRHASPLLRLPSMSEGLIPRPWDSLPEDVAWARNL